MNYTLVPSKVDPRDYIYTPKGTQILNAVDLREWDSLVESQGDLGSCEGNAIVNAYELLIKKEQPAQFAELSRLFVYYNTRVLEGTESEDAGATIRDGLTCVKHIGICTEKLWPYNISKFAVKPTSECYNDAKSRTLTSYKSIKTIESVLEVLNDHIPVVVGMEVFENFTYLTQEDSVLGFPDKIDQSLGGHAVSIVGYNLDKKLFLAKNSYGTDWGDLGYFWIPFDYLRDHAFEKWMFEINLQPSTLV